MGAAGWTTPPLLLPPNWKARACGQLTAATAAAARLQLNTILLLWRRLALNTKDSHMGDSDAGRHPAKGTCFLMQPTRKVCRKNSTDSIADPSILLLAATSTVSTDPDSREIQGNRTKRGVGAGQKTIQGARPRIVGQG